MIKSKKDVQKTYLRLNLIFVTFITIWFHACCFVSPRYSDAQIQMLCGVLSIIIPIIISLGVCYFVLPEKAREQWYIMVLSCVISISIVAPICMTITNFITEVFHFTHPWLYYILTTAHLICFSILELRLYKKLYDAD